MRFFIAFVCLLSFSFSFASEFTPGKRREVKVLQESGRVRVKGFRNTTDATARRENRKQRVKDFVNNPDVARKSRIARKNFKRNQGVV